MAAIVSLRVRAGDGNANLRTEAFERFWEISMTNQWQGANRCRLIVEDEAAGLHFQARQAAQERHAKQSALKAARFGDGGRYIADFNVADADAVEDDGGNPGKAIGGAYRVVEI